ncbi:ABC transporter permease [Microbacterium sp. X-17]|uniref:ABC transporter permease n=1 Tax=Microbacterium sp. X-17 TaxID=3144404 RepID=UPI0031F4B301
MTMTRAEPERLVALDPARPRAPRRRSGSRAPYRAPKRVLLGIGGTVFLLLVAELVVRTGVVVDPQYLPPVSAVLARSLQLAGDPAFLADIGSTMAAWVFALLIAVVVGVPGGIALATSRTGYAASSSVIAAIRPIPAVALIPLALLVFGNGLGMKVGLAAFGIVWPILFNTMYGVRDVDPVARDTARSYGIRGPRMLRRVILPSAAPFILTGARIAASLAFVIIVSTELFAGASSGIGAFILLASSGGGDTLTVIAGAVWAGVIGLLISIALLWVDGRFFRWARRGEAG